MAKIDKVEPVVEPVREKQYYISSANEGISEKLAVSSRFANRLTRGVTGNPNFYVSTEQSARIKQYVPVSKWSKDERAVFLLLQDLIDRTGSVPTVSQISQVSKARGVTREKKNGLMSMQSVGVNEKSGLSVAKVQRALKKLQKRGIVIETI
jgi:hypothetical protein